MGLVEAVVLTAGGALAAVLGVLAGGVRAQRGRDREWLRDKQLAAYQQVLREYAHFAMVLRRAHLSHQPWHYDWSHWSSALTCASLVAPDDVATAIDEFCGSVNTFLGVAATTATITEPLTEAQLDDAMRAPARAQLALVNAIRRSLGRGQGDLATWLGGAPIGP